MLPFLKLRAAPALPREEEEGLPFWKRAGLPVSDSKELARILALPRRGAPSVEQMRSWAEFIKKELGVLPGGACECRSRFGRTCCAELLPIQAWALMEAGEMGGLLGPIKVGGGKTLLNLLTPMAVECKTAVLLLPATLKYQLLEVDWGFYGQHWKLPNLAGGKFFHPGRPVLHVVAYSELSGAKATDLLDRISPDLIVADEAHNLKSWGAARTKRFRRFFSKHTSCKFFCWSGTITSSSLMDYWHLAALALKESSPSPTNYPTAKEWSSHLDAVKFRAPCGALSKLGSSPDAREGYAKRLRESKGVVSSLSSEGLNMPLICSERKIEVPAKVKALLIQLNETWQRPDGEELVDVFSKARCEMELSSGFYYRWKWPRGEASEVIERWLEVRKNWHKEVREKLKHATSHMDTPLLCRQAAIRWFEGYTYIERDEDGREIQHHKVPPLSENGPRPTWKSEHWEEWKEVRQTARPETEPVWVDDFLIEDASRWLSSGPGVVWSGSTAFSKRMVQRNLGVDNFVYCDRGEAGAQAVARLSGNERVVASSKAHGTGKHLQQFSRALVAAPPANLEQLLGRLYRPGQLADEVNFEFYAHTKVFEEALKTQRERARYGEDTLTTQYIANLATWMF